MEKSRPEAKVPNQIKVPNQTTVPTQIQVTGEKRSYKEKEPQEAIKEATKDTFIIRQSPREEK